MRVRIRLFGLAFALACALSVAAQQPEKGYWRAASHSAESITGDISFSGSRISINSASFLISPVRLLKPAEVSAAFDEEAATAGNGQLYRVSIPATHHFLKNNTLCGSQETQWIAVYVANHTLRMAFFSGDDVPVMSFEALQGSNDLCGTYTYVR
ncbi:MAG: hypothetical protein ABSF70_01370 [Terracidiphilus sp.]|jgi:hypothetical protein